MIRNLNHITIAVPNLEAAILQYQNSFGVFVTSPVDLPEHGIRIAIVNLPNTKIELITPLEKTSPLQQFIEKNPQGGVHHLCYEVSDLAIAQKQLQSAGLEVIGDGIPKPGYQGNPVLFFNPKNSLGVLIELEEVRMAKIQSRVDIQSVGLIPPLHTSSIDTLEGVEGIEINIEADFKQHTPLDNKERN